MRIGILGGTGPQGRGLGRRFAMAGHEVLLGSRDAARAQQAAAELAVAGDVTGVANADAAGAEVVVVAVPYEGHADLLASLADALEGKVVVDCVNPLGFDKQGPFPLDVPDGSAAQEAQRILPGSTVVAAFHHVSAVLLDDPEVTDIPGDVLVLGEDRDVVARVIDLVPAIPGARGVYAGRLRLAHTVESFTANLIAVNRRYKAHAGIAVTGLPDATAGTPA
ncbi:NADPH-dependent F420 reductase [Microlunatus spumicola]|uniref:NADPH-dependent F420 reductase n=1 Tax=Microlunatus spumicola TaxID=81499 RepID=A0ABP6Y0B2_9ACTN